MEKNYSKGVIDTVKNYLQKKSWKFNFNEKLEVFDFEICVDKLRKPLQYLIDVHQGTYLMVVSLPLECCLLKKQWYSETYRLVNSINKELTAGSFYIDLESGTVCYKLTHNLENLQLLEEDIQKEVYYAASKVHYYLLGFELVFAGMSSEDALNTCRNKLVSTVYRILLKEASTPL